MPLPTIHPGAKMSKLLGKTVNEFLFKKILNFSKHHLPAFIFQPCTIVHDFPVIHLHFSVPLPPKYFHCITTAISNHTSMAILL